MSDTNKIRVNATLEHIRKCQALWYVVTVIRPCTDPDLDHAISCYAERFPGTFTVIVTKIDQDVTDGLAYHLRDVQYQSIGDFDDCKRKITRDEGRLKNIRSKLKKPDYTPAQKNGLRKTAERLEVDIAEQKAKKFECVVDARNAHIMSMLKRDKAQYLPEGVELPVLFVSNQNYAVHKGVAEQLGPLLDINSTGGPGLRSYALSFAAETVWLNQNDLLRHKIKVLFNGVYGWAQNSSMKHNRGLPEVVKTTQTLWGAISEKSADRGVQSFASNIAGQLRMQYASSFNAVQRYLSIIKNDWNALSFLAFFRKGGKHQTRAVRQQSWNEKFIEWQISNVLDPAWALLPAPQDLFDEGFEKLIKALEDIPDQLDSLPESVPVSVASFKNTLDGRIGSLRANHDRIKSDYQEAYGNIKLDACYDQNTGFFSQAMKPCYRAGKDDKGEGVCTRLKNSLTTYLTNDDPLGKATDKLEIALKDEARAHLQALHVEVVQSLKGADQEFMRILKGGSETLELRAARSEIRKALSNEMPNIERIERDLEEVERKYHGALIQR